jgi:hypothetical protein
MWRPPGLVPGGVVRASAFMPLPGGPELTVPQTAVTSRGRSPARYSMRLVTPRGRQRRADGYADGYAARCRED